jgi:hypothetical protein
MAGRLKTSTTSFPPSWRPELARRPGRGLSLWAAAVISVLVPSCAPATSANGPASYAANLWPQRPVVELSFDVAPDLRSASGRESVVFTPDMRTCELVFRAWPNNPTMAKTGSSLTVTAASVDGRPVTSEISPAGSPPGSPGTLIQLPLARCLEPGQSVRAELGSG